VTKNDWARAIVGHSSAHLLFSAAGPNRSMRTPA